MMKYHLNRQSFFHAGAALLAFSMVVTLAGVASAHDGPEEHSGMAPGPDMGDLPGHCTDSPGDCRANADAYPPHTQGPYFRAGFGAGFASHGLIEDSETIGQYTGAAMNYELAGGMFVAKNTALHLTFFGNLMPKPIERTGDGKNYPFGGEAERLSLNALGIGLTNYIGNTGLLFSVSPAVARLTARVDNGGLAVNGETDFGFAFDSLVAYEWRVNEKMSVGTGVAGGMYIIPDGDIDPARRGYNVGGRFFVAWD